MQQLSLTLLCGIPGSGKSSMIQGLEGKVVSTDGIRNFLAGTENFWAYDKLVFQIARDMVNFFLSINIPVILDATNTTQRARKSFINIAKKHGAYVKVIWLDCPLETAMERNCQRTRQVIPEVIKHFHSGFQKPIHAEGINVIEKWLPDNTLQTRTESWEQ